MMKSQKPYGSSTVAMTLYNLLAIKGRPADLVELLDECRRSHLPEADMEIAQDAAAGLLDRGRVNSEGGLFWLKDPQRRFITHRDRSDADQVDKHGNSLGGWNGWLVSSHGGAPVQLDEVTQ